MFDVSDVHKWFYADTSVIRSKHPICCFHHDTSGENFFVDAKKWVICIGIKFSSARTVAER